MIFEYHNTPIHYQKIGNGPALVFLHGFLESQEMWNPIRPLFSENYTVITLDLPGMGKSGVLQETHTMELMAEAIAALLTHLNIEKTTLVGHSMGGYISLAFVELFAERVEKIIMLNSTFRADTEARVDVRNRSIRLVNEHPRAFVSMAIGNWAVADSRERFKDEIQHLKDLAFQFPISGITAALRGMRDRKDRTDVLAAFDGPKHLLLAQDDPIIPCEETRDAAEKTGTNVKVIPGGHMSMIENYSETEAFLKKVLL